MPITKQSGGARPGSGRREVPDKKQQVRVGIRQSRINVLGEGLIKQIMQEAVEDKYQEMVTATKSSDYAP
jgi:hypothetical protein